MIWNVRTTPSATRRSGVNLVMSVPNSFIDPASGLSTPVI